MKSVKTDEDTLFYIGWALIGIAFLFWAAFRILPLPLGKLLPPCAVHAIFGIYCPGCGGTRAVSALFHGRVLASFICHPVVLYTAVLGGWFLISQSAERLSGGRLKIGLKYRDSYIWIALAIVIVNFIVKNILLIFFHTDLLQVY